MIRYRVVLFQGSKPFAGESGFEDRSFKTREAALAAIRKDVGYCKETAESYSKGEKMKAKLIRRYKQFIYFIVKVQETDDYGVRLVDIWPIS